MGSGSKSSEPEYKTEWYLPAQIALANGDYTNASVYAYMSGDANFMSMTNMIAQQKQTEASNKKLAEQQAENQRKSEEQSAQLASQNATIQASTDQASNANSKATVVADSYTREVKGNANAGNQTSGQVSGAQTARKTLQGFGGGSNEDMQDAETWY